MTWLLEFRGFAITIFLEKQKGDKFIHNDR
jgi:hypothetical protein